MIEKEVKQLKNLDELINKLGIYGRFQFLAFLGLRFTLFIFGFSIIQMAYAGMNPGWHCMISTLDDGFPSSAFNGIGEAEDKINDIDVNLTMTSVSRNAVLGNQTFKVCSINGTKCDVFQFIGTSRTIVTEWDLVCDKAWIKQIIISIQMVGFFTGTLLSGHLGDRFGRKKVFYTSLMIGSIVELLTAFSISWEMFAVCKFFMGTFIGSSVVIGYPYYLEISPSSWRPFVAGFPSFSIGVCVFAGAAYVFDDWSSLHFTGAALILPFLIGWFYFPESPRWLVVHGKLDLAQKAVAKIARSNRKPVPPGTVDLIANIFREEKDIRQTVKKYTLIDIFSTFQIAKVTLTMAYIGCTFNIVLLGISLGISALYGNVFLNIFIMAALQMPAQFSISYSLRRFGRRLSLIFLIILSVLGSGGCLIVIFAAQDLPYKYALVSALCLWTRITIGVAVNINNLWCNELYPTVVRSLGFSFVTMSSRFGAIISPFLVNFERMPVASYAIITFLLVTSGLLALIPQETRNLPLGDSTAKTGKFELQDDVTLLEDKSAQDARLPPLSKSSEHDGSPASTIKV